MHAYIVMRFMHLSKFGEIRYYKAVSFTLQLGENVLCAAVLVKLWGST